MVMDHHVTKQTKTSKRLKQGNELSTSQTQNKKNKPPQRGVGVAVLERNRLREEYLNKMTEMPSSLHHPSTLQNGVVQFPPAAPQMMFSGGPNNLFMDHNPNANPGYRFDNMFSVPNYLKGGSASDACASCIKKKRVNNNNLNTPNQFRYGINNNNVVEKVDYTGRNLCFSPQLREAMSGYRVWTGGNGRPEYEFFPGKDGNTTSSWCVSGTERGGMIGLHGGEGSSCVTAATSYEEGSTCCSVDLSLKL